jgi:hypothetical protein
VRGKYRRKRFNKACRLWGKQIADGQAILYTIPPGFLAPLKKAKP